MVMSGKKGSVLPHEKSKESTTEVEQMIEEDMKNGNF